MLKMHHPLSQLQAGKFSEDWNHEKFENFKMENHKNYEMKSLARKFF